MTCAKVIKLRQLVADLAVAVAECSMPHGQPSGVSEEAHESALEMLAEHAGPEMAREGPARGADGFHSLSGLREARDRLRRLGERTEASEGGEGNQSVVVRTEVDYLVRVPADWDDGDIDFFFNESSHCIDNEFRKLGHYDSEAESGKCCCSNSITKVLRDAGPDDLEHMKWGR